MKHFGITDGKMTCDVLAGEQGPSCASVKQIPSFKLIHMRFVDEEAVVVVEDLSAAERCPTDSEPPSKRRKPQRQGSRSYLTSHTAHTSHEVESGASPSKFVPRSLSVLDMMKLGKVISKKATSVEIYTFDMKCMSWSETPIMVEFTIEPEPFGVGGFRKAFRATSSHKNFRSFTWVIKKYLPKVYFISKKTFKISEILLLYILLYMEIITIIMNIILITI
jgi:hypothetical protein